MASKNKIVKYKSSNNFNIGVVIFFIIIIYVIFNIFSYFTKTHIAEYRVQQGTIASSHIYQGIAVRDETVEYATHDGYINYYIKNASKVSANDIIYSIDTVGNIYDKIAETTASTEEIAEETLNNISEKLDTFTQDYDANHFSESYIFFNNLSSEIAQTVNTNALAKLSDEVKEAENNQTFHRVKSSKDGVISYEMDGYEGYSIDDILESNLNYASYKKIHLFSDSQITASTPVYKRVNSEDWNIIVPISEDLAKELNEETYLRIRFCKDDFTTNAASSLMKKEGEYYLNLSLSRAMVRYINDRFLDIELVMNEKDGLKIPKSAITSKEFFTIPKQYFTAGGDSSEPGIMLKHSVNGEESIKMLFPTVYHETEDYYYIDSEEVSEGDLILKEDSSSTYQIGTDKASLVGVYNINKGYAVFKQINIIYENEEYAIIETKTAYGISLYDHIALNASEIKEHQLTSN